MPLPSKNGSLGFIYNQLQSHSKKLCQTNGALALNEYGINIVSYLCSPYNPNPIRGGKGLVDISSLPETAKKTPDALIDAIEKGGASALIIDPYMSQKYPGLGGCPEIQNALLNRGWKQLTYSFANDGQCVAAYIK